MMQLLLPLVIIMGAVWNGWQTTWQGVVQQDDGTGNGDEPYFDDDSDGL
jgi:hypothetical protein